MNKAQLTRLLGDKLISIPKGQAIELVIIDGLTSYAAEKQVYGRPTSTIARLVKDVRADYQRCLDVSAL